MNFQDFLMQSSAQAGWPLEKDQVDAYERYFQLLVEWNKKLNLTAITEAQEVALKHMVDSLTCLDICAKRCYSCRVGIELALVVCEC